LSGGVVDLGGGRHGGQTATAVTSMAVHVVGKFTFVKIQFMVNKAQKLKQQATWLESSMRFIKWPKIFQSYGDVPAQMSDNSSPNFILLSCTFNIVFLVLLFSTNFFLFSLHYNLPPFFHFS
jgi:hypothetical protein